MTTARPPFGVRPSWRRWVTRAELDDMMQIRNYFDEDGKCVGSNLGVTLSGVKVKQHTGRSRRRDARWAARHGCHVDSQGIIRKGLV